MNESLDWARWPAGISHCSKDLSGIGQYPVAKEFLAAFNSNLVQVTINSFPRKECPDWWQRICTEILSLLSFQVLLSLCLFESALWCKMVEYNPDNSTRSRSATGGSCVLPSNSGIGNCSGGQNLGRRQQQQQLQDVWCDKPQLQQRVNHCQLCVFRDYSVNI